MSVNINGTNYYLGWRPDSEDKRDLLYKAPMIVKNPPKYSLKPLCPSPYNQMEANSCVSNAVAGAIVIDQKKEKISTFDPSRLFLYYFSRQAENSLPADNGTSVRTVIKVAASLGAPPEAIWPYDLNNLNIQPTSPVITSAKSHKIIKYERVNPFSAVTLKTVIAHEKSAVIFGFVVYQSFITKAVAATGMVPIPAPGEKPIGGHCMAAIGYDDSTKLFEVLNQWGTGWGVGGYCYMPYSYLSNIMLVSDLWKIKTTA
jgi:C1A family cysteine protease